MKPSNFFNGFVDKSSELIYNGDDVIQLDIGIKSANISDPEGFLIENSELVKLFLR